MDASRQPTQPVAGALVQPVPRMSTWLWAGHCQPVLWSRGESFGGEGRAHILAEWKSTPRSLDRCRIAVLGAVAFRSGEVPEEAALAGSRLGQYVEPDSGHTAAESELAAAKGCDDGT